MLGRLECLASPAPHWGPGSSARLPWALKQEADHTDTSTLALAALLPSTWGQVSAALKAPAVLHSSSAPLKLGVGWTPVPPFAQRPPIS